ncbi:major facilitator superfamily domain-containing protein [Triangularia verruculosa]|uniref:Major facilitator superfamily domain-containing protein n=1 Tax=Triangularia verruculosa TaxID=2587418 RepID=A0AAN6X9Z3_9PEZI|nr:major facilitator superfamily domain-containing protein [Triangularia verruculosa]
MFGDYTFDGNKEGRPSNSNNGGVNVSSNSSTSTAAGEAVDGEKRKMIITPPSTSTGSWESSSSDSDALEKGHYENDDDDDDGDEDIDPFERGRGVNRMGRGHDHDDEEQSPMTVKRKPKKEFTYTAEEEKAVVRKFDKKVVVFMAVLYMLAFLDRSNIGNARIANMDTDLQSDPPNPQYYSYALSSFYLAYLLFEWMAILWRLIPAHIYVSALVASWGIVACLQGIATSYPILIALRFFLGIGEAGFTGVPFYLSFFFKREELALRTAIFISAAPLATSFSSTLAFAITSLSNIIPIAPWRLLFLLEGLPCILIAGLAFSIIPDSPSTASFLSPRQKKIARVRLPPSSSPSNNGTGLSALKDPTAWTTSLIIMLTNLAYSSLPAFLPTILTSMGHSPLSSQALSAPPYLLSFLTVIVTAYLSDLYRARGPFLIFHAVFSFAGYLLLSLSSTFGLSPGSWLRYAAVFPAAIGFFNVVVLTIAWNVNNSRGGAKEKGVGFALMQVVGQLGPLGGMWLYPDADGPFYTAGMGVCAAAMAGVVVLAGGLRVYMRGQNTKWDGEEEEGRGGEEGVMLMERGVERKKERGFRYML